MNTIKKNVRILCPLVDRNSNVIARFDGEMCMCRIKSRPNACKLRLGLRNNLKLIIQYHI